MKSAAAAFAVLALGVGGVACGGGGNGAAGVLAQASERLAEVRSGRISISGRITRIGGQDANVQAAGSFAVAGPRQPPVARFVYTGDGTRTRRIVRTDAPLRTVRLQDWIEDPELQPGGMVDGVPTEHVHGQLVSRALLDDVRALGLGPSLGVPGSPSGFVDVWVATRDRIPRRLLVTADVGLQLPEGMAAALGRAVGATVRLELELTQPVLRTEDGPATVLP